MTIWPGLGSKFQVMKYPFVQQQLGNAFNKPSYQRQPMKPLQNFAGGLYNFLQGRAKARGLTSTQDQAAALAAAMQQMGIGGNGSVTGWGL